MIKYVYLLLLFLFFGLNVFSDTYTWDGENLDTDWNSDINWYNNTTSTNDDGHPVAGDDVIIDTAISGFYPSLPVGGITLNSLTINNGSLLVNGETLNITNGLAVAGTLDNSNAGGVVNCNGATVNFTGGNYTNGGTFNIIGAGTTFTTNNQNFGTLNIAGTVTTLNGNLNASNLTINGSITCGGNNVSVSNNLTGTGDLTCGAGTLDVNGDFNISGDTTLSSTTTNIGGNFTATGATFNDNGGTIVFDGTAGTSINANGKNLGNVEMQVNKSLSNTLNCNNLNISAGTLTTGANTINVGSSLTVAGTLNNLNAGGIINCNGTTVDFTGGNYTNGGTFNIIGVGTTFTTNNQDFGTLNIAGTVTTLNDDLNASNLTINGSISCGGNNVSVSNNLTGTGDLTCGAGTLDVNGDFNISGDTTLSSTTTNIGGNFTATGATFNHNGGTIVFDGTAGTSINANGKNLGNVEIQVNKSLSNTLNCNNLNISAGTLTTGANTINVGSSLTVAGTLNNLNAGGIINCNGTTVDFTGGNYTNGGTFNIIGVGTTFTTNNQNFGTLNIAGTVTTLNGNLTAGNTTINNGAVLTTGSNNLTLNTLVCNGLLDVSGGGNIQINGNVTSPGIGLKTITGGAGTINITGNVTLAILTGGAGAIDISGNLNTSGNFTASSGNTTLGGNLTVGGVFSHNNGTFIFDGTTNIGTNGLVFNNVTINNGRTLITGNNSLTVNGNISGNGNLTCGNQPISISGDVTLATLTGGAGAIDINANSTIGIYNEGTGNTNFGGDLTLTTFVNNATGIITFDGNNGSIITATNQNLGNIVFSANKTIGANFIANNITLSAGTLTDGGQTLTIEGNWANTGGNLTATGTVTLTTVSTATISGNTTFNNLTCTTAGKTINISGNNSFSTLSINSNGGTINFTTGTTQTITTNLVLQGAVGGMSNFLNLTGVGVWNINAPATQTVRYVNVTNSNALSGSNITANDSKNSTPPTNTNWTFGVNNFQWRATAVNRVWTNIANWDLGFVPNNGDNITILVTANYPELPANYTANNLSISAAGASLDTMGYNLTVNGTFTNNGTLRVRGGETLPASLNQGTVNYYHTIANNLHSTTYNNLTISGSATYSTIGVTTVNGTLLVNGTGTLILINNLTTTNLTINTAAGTIQVGGNTLTVTNAKTLSTGQITLSTGTLNFSGSNTTLAGTSIILSSNGYIDNTGGDFTINNAGSTLTLSTGRLVCSAFSHTNGVVNAGTNGVNALTCTTFNKGAGGTFNGGSARIISTGATFTISGGFNCGTSTIVLQSGVATTLTSTSNLYNVVINTINTVNLGGNITQAASGTLTYSANGTLNIATWTWTLGANYSHTTGTLSIGNNGIFTGATNYDLSFTGGTVNQGTAGNPGTVTGRDITINGATYICSGNSTINCARNFTLSTAWTPANSTINMVTNGGNFSSNQTVYNVNINCNPSTVTLQTPLTLSNTLTITSGTLDANGQTITIGGSFINNGGIGAYTHNNNTVIFNGATTPASLQSGGSTLYNIEVSKNAGTTLQLIANNLTVVNNLTMTSGTLNLNTQNMILNSSPSLTGGVIEFNGRIINAGTNPITFNGTNANQTTSGGTLNCGNFTLSSGTIATNGGATPFNNNCADFDISGGTYYARGSTITASGNVSITGGIFDCGTSLIEMNGNTPQKSIDCNTQNLYDFTISLGGDIIQSSTNLNILRNFTNNGSFSHNNNTVIFTGTTFASLRSGGSDFYNISVSKTGTTLQVTGNDLTVNNILTVTSGNFNLNTQNMALNSSPLLNGGVIEFNGQTINAGVNSITFNGTNTNQTTNSGTLNCGDFTLSNGTIATNGVETPFNLNCANFNMSNGTYYAKTSTITASGNVSITGGTFNRGTSSIYMNGSGQINCNQQINNLYLNPTAPQTVSITTNNLDIDGLLNLNSNATLNFVPASTVTLNVNSTTTNRGTISGVNTSGLITFNGVADSTSAGIVSSGSGGIVCNNTVDFTGGTLNGSVTGDPNLIFNNSVTFGTYNHNNDRVYITNGTLTTNNQTFYDLDITTNSVTLANSLNVLRNLNITSTLVCGANDINIGNTIPDSGSIDISGNITSTGTITFNGSNLQDFRVTNGTFNNLVINKSASINTVTLLNSSNDLTIGGTLTINTGTFNQNRTITVNNGASSLQAIDISANGVLSNVSGGANCNLTVGTNGVNNDGEIRLHGNLLQIRSTLAGAQRDWRGIGVFNIRSVDVQDQTAISVTPTEILCEDGYPGTDSGNNINWFVGAHTKTISGFTYDNNISAPTPNPTTEVELIVYNGVTRSFFRKTSDMTGAFTFNKVPMVAGNSILIYERTNQMATTFSVSSGNAINNYNLYRNHITNRNDNGGNTTNLDIRNVSGATIGLRCSVDMANNLTLANNYNLYIQGSYTPNGNITTQGSGGFDIRGSLTNNANTFNVAGDWDNTSGSVNLTGTNTVNFNGINQSIVSGGTGVNKQFNNIIHSGSGILQLMTNPLYIKADFTNSSNNFDINGLDITICGNLNISGGVFDATTGTPNIYLLGNWTDSGTFNSGNSTLFLNGGANQIINAEPNFNNFIIDKSLGNATISGNVTAHYIALYNGTLTFSGGQTLRSTTDFLAIGANNVNSLTIDGWGGPTRLSVPGSFSGSFDAGGGGPTLVVDNDFYVNGCSMIGSANWYLVIPDNDNDIRKARAYGDINVSYSQANYWVSAIEPDTPNNPKDLGHNTRWDFARPQIVSVETVSHNVIRVVFNKLIENSNNEIWLAVTDNISNPISYDNNPTKIFVGSYNNIDCQAGNETTGKGDMGDAATPIYILCGETWNTDASGDSVGNINSTDRLGVHKNILINLILKKGALRDNRKNQIAAITYNNTLDRCEPVLVSATLGSEVEGSNTFNYLRLRYSEPINSNNITTTPKNSDNGVVGISNGSVGGGLTTAGTFKGFGSATTSGDVVTYSDSTTGTTSGRDDSNTVYKDVTSHTFTIRLGGNVSDGGCLRGSVNPSGLFTSLANIKDLSGNNLINSLSYAPTTDYRPTISGSWILIPPTFANIKTNEKPTLTNGYIDNLIIDFSQSVQIYDNEASFGNSSIIWGTTNYTVSNHNFSTATIQNNFNLNIDENKLANIYGDTDATPVVTYDQNSNFKIITNLGRVEMNQGENFIAIDDCAPVMTKVSFGIDDPSFVYDSAPYIRQWDGDTKGTDPGATPNFSLGSILSPTERTYHNYILFRYSEPIIDFNGVTVDSSSDGYNFTSDQRSSATFGDFETVSNKVTVKGFGSFNGDIKVDSESNFILRDDNRNTFLHVAGFYDGSKFVGHITNQTKASVPNQTGLYYFTTVDSSLVKDVMNLSLKQKNDVGNKDLTIDYIKNWDITPPDFRYINETITYRGDPSSSDKVTSKLSDGATYGSPLITSVEFAMTEAIRDLDTSTDMSGAFAFRFYKNGVDYNNASSLKYSTNVNKLGDIINSYNGTFVSDGDPNDQGFSVYFDTVIGMSDEAQIKWTYSAISNKIISDLRGNMLANVTTERLTLENAPPYIKETRAVVGANKIYIEFNEPVLNRTYNEITINEFGYTDIINNTNFLTGIQKLEGSKYILTFAEPLDQNHIVEDIIYIKPGEVQDLLNNVVKEEIDNPLSYIGINFFNNVTIEDFIHQGENWKITVFDGSNKVGVENMRVTANINVNKFRNFRPILYFDVLPNSLFWYPNVNREARMVLGNSKGNNNWEFIIPSNDSELKSGNELSFVFKIGNLYSYRSPHSLDSPNFTPYDAETFRVKIQDIKLQNNSVTILNNVINPTKGELTKLLYTLNNEGPVSIVIYDLAGDAVKMLKGEAESAGEHIVHWDGKNENGKIVARGVYFIRVRAPGIFNQIRKVLVVK